MNGLHKLHNKIFTIVKTIIISDISVCFADKSGWLGPLADLLEEEIILPGESRDNSASVIRGGAPEKPKNWAYLPPRSPTTSTTSSSDSYKVC